MCLQSLTFTFINTTDAGVIVATADAVHRLAGVTVATNISERKLTIETTNSGAFNSALNYIANESPLGNFFQLAPIKE